MAYSSDDLQCLTSNINGTFNLWLYRGTDTAADVDASGYFTDGEDRGMQLGDIVIQVEPDGTGASIQRVSAISSAGAATTVDFTT